MNQDDMNDAGAPAEPQLTPKLSAKWALGKGQLAVVALWTTLFIVLNYLPLQWGELWGQVALGNWILDHRELPPEDPYQPLAEGMPLVDSRWLSQVVLALADRSAGPDGLVFLLSAVTIAAWLIVWRVLFLRTSRFCSSLVIVGLMMAVSRTRWTSFRAETLGMLAFAILWWLLASDRDRETGRMRFLLRTWLGAPLLLAVWANLDESFVCGLAVVGTYALCALWSAIRSRRAPDSAVPSEKRGNWVWLAEFAVLATTCNPYGMSLLWHSLLTFRNANLRDMLEGQPLSFGGLGSYEFVAAWTLGIVAIRRSPRTLTASDAARLALFSLVTLQFSRMIGWFAVVWGITLAPHIADVLGELWPWRYKTANPGGETLPARDPHSSPPSFRYSYIALLVLWCGLAFAPASRLVLGGQPRKPVQIYGRDTPLEALEYLREHPPQGQIFNPHTWGDMILRNGPPGCPVFIISNIQSVPRRVWEDYLIISRGQPNWKNALGRYAAETVVVDPVRMSVLDKNLRLEKGWRIVHEDDHAVIFERRAVPVAKDRKDTPADEKKPARAEAPNGSDQ